MLREGTGVKEKALMGALGLEARREIGKPASEEQGEGARSKCKGFCRAWRGRKEEGRKNKV